MPDTVDPLESISLIVNRHVVAEDCAQSRTRLTNRRRKSRLNLTCGYYRSAGSARTARFANARADFAEIGSTRNRQSRTSAKSAHIHFGSSTIDSRVIRSSNTSGRSSMTSKSRCFGLMKPSCTA